MRYTLYYRPKPGEERGWPVPSPDGTPLLVVEGHDEAESMLNALLESKRLMGDRSDYVVGEYGQDGDPPATEAPAESASAAEADTDAAIEQARQVAYNVRIGRAMAVMLNARQLYTVGMQELQNAVSGPVELPKEVGPSIARLDPRVTAVLVNSVAQAAQQEFDASLLLRGLVQHTVGWLTQVVDKMVRKDAAETSARAHQADAERRARPVPIGFSFVGPPAPPNTLLPRDKAAVFAGSPAHVTLTLDTVTRTAAASGAVVVRFAGVKSASPEGVGVIHEGQWAGVAATSAGTGELMAQLQGHWGRPDLLVVDDLPLAAKAEGADGPEDAADALRRVSHWAQSVGAAVAGGVPLSEPLPDVEKRMDWERLRTHSYLKLIAEVPK